MNCAFSDLSEEEQIAQLATLAHDMLADYDIAPKSVEMINHGYNTTFAVVTQSNERFALRINVNSPRSVSNLRAEVAWMTFLASEGSVALPKPVPTTNGDVVTIRWSDALLRDTPAILFSDVTR